jgi:aldehyde dehydrogenase (NAD+)
MTESDYTPISDLANVCSDFLIPFLLFIYHSQIHTALRQTFRSGLTLPLPFRRHQLRQLALFARENADAIASCILTDLGRPRQETIMAEVGGVIERSLLAAEQVEKWLGGDDGEEIKLGGWQKGWKAKVEKRAKGVVLVIACVDGLAPISH